MKIKKVIPRSDWVLAVISDDGRTGTFDVSPFLVYEGFKELAKGSEFMKVSNGGYFVEWACGADLSVDTIEAHWKVIGDVPKLALE